MNNFFYKEAQRILDLPPYVFATIERLKAEKKAQGLDLIDLGMGNPDLPVHPDIIDEFVKSVKENESWRYPEFKGLEDFRKAVSSFCKRQYNIEIDYNCEVMPLIGSKEGVAHLIFALVNNGDYTICPMPAYPAHFRVTVLAGGIPFALPVDENYLPKFNKIPKDILQKTKLIILSYPTNPTSTFANLKVFEEAVKFCKENNKILIHDFAYAEIYFNGNKPLSMLSVKGAKDICIEFHTLSKTFSMAGFRIGFAVGNKDLISSLAKIKSNLDYGLFSASQKAAIKALSLDNSELDKTRQIYQKRMYLLLEGIKSLGCDLKTPLGTMYLWLPVPKGYDATSFTMKLLEETGIIVSPGNAFGNEGNGHIRIAVVESSNRIKEAINRLKKANINWH